MNKNNSITDDQNKNAKKASATSASTQLDIDTSTKITQFHTVNHARVHEQIRSKTLKRNILNAPDKSVKRTLIVSTPAERYVFSSNPEAPLQTSDQNVRAMSISKNESIKHFSKTSLVIEQKPQVQTIRPAEIIAPPKSRIDELVDRVLEKQTNPTQIDPIKSKARSKLFQVSLVTVPVLVMGLFVYGAANITKIQLKVASTTTGFATKVPSYKPAGYSLNQMSYKTGIFASEFNNKKAGSYIITQKSTSWDNHALQSNYLAVLSSHYSQIHIGYKTVFLYGNGNATWVQNGIWYQVNTDGALSESQLINIANSL